MIEERYRERRERADLQEIILNVVAAAGVIGVGFIFPNALGMMKKAGLLPSARQKDSIRAAQQRLIKNGLLNWEGKKLRLTESGERRLRYLRISNYRLPKPKKWDERWRVLIFDIPEKRRKLREKIREILMVAGFVRLQDSVWIYPYNCEEFITLLKADFRVGKAMLYMIVDTLEYDNPFRKKFGLN